MSLSLSRRTEVNNAFSEWLTRPDGKEWERVAFAEVLIPGVKNPLGDFWTERAIVDAAHMFMVRGFIRDVNHDLQDHSAEWSVVESFIARDGDPTFVPGSWVVGIKVHSDELWNAILSNEINGFSYEAVVSYVMAILEDDFTSFSYDVQGVTEPAPDGHTHTFALVVDSNNRPVSGITGITNGHMHTIATHSLTDTTDGHSHRFNMIQLGAK